MSARIVLPFDFNPSQQVKQTTANYTVPSGKYGLFDIERVEYDIAPTVSLANGTYNYLPTTLINGDFKSCNVIANLDLRTTGTRAWDFTPSHPLPCAGLYLSLRYSAGTGSANSNAIPKNALDSSPSALLTVSITGGFNQASLSPSTVPLIDLVRVNLIRSGGTLSYFAAIQILDEPKAERAVWLTQGDVISATLGAVTFSAQIYNRIS
jgi:hypothetical protein